MLYTHVFNACNVCVCGGGGGVVHPCTHACVCRVSQRKESAKINLWQVHHATNEKKFQKRSSKACRSLNVSGPDLIHVHECKRKVFYLMPVAKWAKTAFLHGPTV